MHHFGFFITTYSNMLNDYHQWHVEKLDTYDSGINIQPKLNGYRLAFYDIDCRIPLNNVAL